MDIVTSGAASVERIDQTLERLAARTGSRLLRLSPIALLQPLATTGTSTATGIAFSSLSTTVDRPSRTSGAALKSAEASPELTSLAIDWQADTLPDVGEDLQTTEWRRLANRLHWDVFEKTLGKTATASAHSRILEKAGDFSNCSVIDLSCGSSRLCFELARSAAFCVANDWHWQSSSTLRGRPCPENVFFTGMDARRLRVKTRFDLAICKNTLHHMTTQEDAAKLITTLREVARRVVLVDPAPPRSEGLVPSLYHYYHRFWCGDRAASFRPRDRLLRLVATHLPEGVHLDYDHFVTRKGRYHLLAWTNRDF